LKLVTKAVLPEIVILVKKEPTYISDIVEIVQKDIMVIQKTESVTIVVLNVLPVHLLPVVLNVHSDTSCTKMDVDVSDLVMKDISDMNYNMNVELVMVFVELVLN
jgi:hypothetical protein